MREEIPFNPLDKRHLGESVAEALTLREVGPLPPVEPFLGAGVYAIYYSGDHAAYSRIVQPTRAGDYAHPIYVGKAVPKGARKGGYGLGENPGTAMYNRLQEHAESIDAVDNLDLADFHCRYLVVDDIWIPLAESLMIESFSPVWNKVIDGFGNHDPGGGRRKQARSPWDVLHPGRVWAEKQAMGRKSEAELIAMIEAFFLGRTDVVLEPPVTDPGVTEEDFDQET